MTKFIITIASIFLAISVFAQNETTKKYQDTSLDFETRALALVQQMTLEEKISQLGNNAPAIPRLGIDQYDWWNECLHGVARSGTATVFPQAIGMAASFDLNMMSTVANVISDEARAKHHEALRNKNFERYSGLTMWSPNINIFRDPRWGRGHETYGEDPYLTGQMGIRFVKGLQGDDAKYLKVVATAKHYAVHNGPEPDRHSFNVVPDARDFWETYMPAFHDLMVDAKAYSIMGAYNRVDGEAAAGSWMLLEDILRQRWGFEGYVVSDCGAINDISANHKIVNSSEEAAAVGLRHGCDLNCGGVYQAEMLNALKQGFIDEGEIDLSVYRLMLARMKLGMFDPVALVPYAQIPYELNNCEAHDVISKEMALKTMTLLKNDGILPLNKKVKSIAVIGPNADNIEALRANYYGDASNPVTVIDGIRKVAGKKVDVFYAEGCPLVIDEVSVSDYSIVDAKYLSTIEKNGKSNSGLKGEYYNNSELKGAPTYVRIDQEIDFDWMTNSPTKTALAQGIVTSETSIKQDYFSVRWTGKLKAPETGEYQLGVISDDGCRLWINDKKIADGWSNHSMQPYLGAVSLTKGELYDIRIDYFEGEQGAGAKLVWILPNGVEDKDDNLLELSKAELAAVKAADVAIFVGGLDATWEGEEMNRKVTGFLGGDRTSIELPETQLNALRAMKATGTPVVFVMMAGSAISLDGLENELDAILMGWYPGQRGGDAIADVLFGKYNPAGRLPVTFYTSTDELADFTNYNMQAGKGFTYRYYTGEPLFAFGHGLSYTSFEYSDLQIDKSAICDTDSITVTLTVKNTGKVDGEEVVQLYVRDVESEIVMPQKQLRDFDRIALKKGEQQSLSFKLKAADDMRYYNPLYRRYMVESGDFEIQVGASSEDIRLKGKVTVE